MESGRSEARNSAGQSSERQLGPNLFRSALIAGESYSGTQFVYAASGWSL